MNAENKNNNPWVDKFNELVNTCQAEFKRTTEIGKKMVSASQSNAQLQEEYQKLGKIVTKALKNGELTWENKKVHELVDLIDNLKKELKGFEKDVQDLKNY
jgi:RNA processing factor Prp31